MTVDELRKAILKLPALPDKAERFTWLSRRIQLRRRILKDDPKEFLTWPLLHETMFVRDAPYISTEARELDHSKWWKEAVVEPRFGKNSQDSSMWDFVSVCTNLIHQAYHLRMWERRTGRKVEDLSRVLEFGGGYGAMALIFQRLGYQGIYSIEDFPEFSLLQRFYLSNALDDIGNIQFNHSVASLDLYIALWSISEVEPYEKHRPKRNIPNAQSYLFAYAPRWDGYDNQAYFDEFKEGKPDYKWWNWKIEHLPNSWYLIGDKVG